MSHRRSNIVAFVKSTPSGFASSVTKLHSARCVIAPGSLSKTPRFVAKAARLHAVAPDIAAMVEELLDEMLADYATAR